jgi:hypothetical protein
VTRPAFIPEALWTQLCSNGALNACSQESDTQPVVKLFTPDAQATWLLREADPRDPDLAFGLCDLGLGCPELGYVSLAELARVRGPLGLAIELDASFVATEPLSVYAKAPRAAGRIVTPPPTSQP